MLVLERQLDSLYSAFDKDPHAVIALRVRHPDGCIWTVENRTLTLSTENGSATATFDLTQHTIGSLADAIAASGFALIYRNQDYAGIGAAALISGTGRQSISDGDAIPMHTSPLWSFLDAYATEIEAAGENIDEAIKELYLLTSTGEFLDYWGEFFGVPRSGRDDAHYRQFIIDETLRPRVNPIAIENAVEALTGKSVEIYEPWRDMFVLSGSRMDEDKLLPDGKIVARGLIRPRSRGPISWDDALPVIARNRAAGTVVIDPETLFDPFYATAGEPKDRVKYAIDVLSRAWVMLAGDEALSVDLTLSVSWQVLNAVAVVFQLRSVSVGGLNTPLPHLTPPRSISKATVCLSDGLILGELNTRFGFSIFGGITGSQYLSGSATQKGYALSDLDTLGTWVPVPEVFCREDKSFIDQEPDVSVSWIANVLVRSSTKTSTTLDAYRLSGEEQTFAVRNAMSRLTSVTYRYDGLYARLTPPRNIGMASITLSDGLSIGDVNARFGISGYFITPESWRLSVLGRLDELVPSPDAPEIEPPDVLEFSLSTEWTGNDHSIRIIDSSILSYATGRANAAPALDLMRLSEGIPSFAVSDTPSRVNSAAVQLGDGTIYVSAFRDLVSSVLHGDYVVSSATYLGKTGFASLFGDAYQWVGGWGTDRTWVPQNVVAWRTDENATP